MESATSSIAPPALAAETVDLAGELIGDEGEARLCCDWRGLRYRERGDPIPGRGASGPSALVMGRAAPSFMIHLRGDEHPTSPPATSPPGGEERSTPPGTSQRGGGGGGEPVGAGSRRWCGRPRSSSTSALRMTSTPRIPTGIRWRCWSTGSTSSGRSGSRSRPPRSSATASAGATASRGSTTTRSAATSSTSTSRPRAASAGARTRARRTCTSPRSLSRSRSSTAAVPGLELER